MTTGKPHVRPVKVHLPSPELSTTVVRGVGFRAESSGGWRGPKRDTYREARADLREHERRSDNIGQR